jgi:hypothetical protein
MGLMTQPQVRVEVVELGPGGQRQIAAEERLTELLRDRADDVRSAIREVADLTRGALEPEDGHDGQRITRLEAKFGLTLTAETGVLIAKAGAEASFEVTLTVDRT